jgi:hypothetical protein
MKIINIPLENEGQLKYLGTTLTNQNCFHGIKADLGRAIAQAVSC